MRYLVSSILIIFSFALFSCESSENSILSTDNLVKNSDNPTKLKFDRRIDILDLDDIFISTKEIDGTIGGEITLDTVFTNLQGNLISIEASLIIEPNSFTGTKNITIRPDPSSGSIEFSPHLTFNVPAKLDLKFTGIDLSRLGFNYHDKVDFVFRADDGTVEFIVKDKCNMNWNENKLYVKKARLPHFSRYIFVRKND
ncbi:MAG: hypothetical protein ABI638_07230 [Ignavibacteriota bacterium]